MIVLTLPQSTNPDLPLAQALPCLLGGIGLYLVNCAPKVE